MSYHFWCNLGDVARDRLASPAVVCHFELDWVANFQVFNGPVKLGEVEEKSGLTVATLNKSVGVLKREKNPFSEIQETRKNNCQLL